MHLLAPVSLVDLLVVLAAWFHFARPVSGAQTLRVGCFNIKYDTEAPLEFRTGGKKARPSSSTAAPTANAFAVRETSRIRKEQKRLEAVTDSSQFEPKDPPLPNQQLRRRRALDSARPHHTAASLPQDRSWAVRRVPLVLQLLDEQLDVFGLQEVLHNQLQDLRHLFGSEFDCVGVGRIDGDTLGEAVGLRRNSMSSD